MLVRVLPRPIDNTFRGRQPAVWVFLLVGIVKAAQGAAVLFGGASVVSSAKGIPLDTYPQAAAETIVSLWAILGLTRLLICSLCLLVVARYRSLLPFMLGFLFLQDVGRRLIFYLLPIVRVGAPLGPTVNLILMALTTAGLVFSLLPRSNSPQAA